MIAGGGSNLDTYPKTERRALEILRNLSQFLEINSLVKYLERDIAALPPLPAPLPAASSEPKPTETKAARDERTCYFCGKTVSVQTKNEFLFSSNVFMPPGISKGFVESAKLST